MTDDGFGMDAAWLVALNRTADVSSTQGGEHGLGLKLVRQITCLLYTSDAADDQ